MKQSESGYATDADQAEQYDEENEREEDRSGLLVLTLGLLTPVPPDFGSRTDGLLVNFQCYCYASRHSSTTHQATKSALGVAMVGGGA